MRVCVCFLLSDSACVCVYICGQVTIAQYSSLVVKEAGKNKTVGQFQVIGKAWDDSLGGFNFDLVITEILADRFNAIWNKKKSGAGKDIRDFARPMTKLRVEATKLREILSANQEMSYKAEQLHAGAVGWGGMVCGSVWHSCCGYV